MHSNGQVAYEKWAELVPSGQLDWYQLPSSAKAGWNEIAEAVVANENNRVKMAREQDRRDQDGG